MTELITNALALPEVETFKKEIEAINRFQQVVQSQFIRGHDFGVIPGTPKPTLLKPGAEKIAKLLGLADQYAIMDKTEDWQKPFFRFMIKASLVHIQTGAIVSEGLGECNSMEAKYRWREAKPKCPICNAEAIIRGKKEWGGGWLCFKKRGGCGAKFRDGDKSIESQPTGRVENDDIYSVVNTILKMAKKRALVDASLSAGRLSNVFTQDIEDTQPPEEGDPDPSASPSAPSTADANLSPATARSGLATAPGQPQTETQPGQAQQPVASKNGGGAEPQPTPETHPGASGGKALSMDACVEQVNKMMEFDLKPLFAAVAEKCGKQIDQWAHVWQRSKMTPETVLELAKKVAEK